jgi:hypothetical protein
MPASRLADWADAAGDDLLANRSVPPGPNVSPPPQDSSRAAAAARALQQLELEVAHVAASLH